MTSGSLMISNRYADGPAGTSNTKVVVYDSPGRRAVVSGVPKSSADPRHGWKRSPASFTRDTRRGPGASGPLPRNFEIVLPSNQVSSFTTTNTPFFATTGAASGPIILVEYVPRTE